MDSKENRVKLITNPRSRRIEIAPISVPLEQPQQQRQHSIICAGSGLNYRSFREDESLASLESTILAGSLTINDRNCEEDEDKDDEEEEEDEYDGEYSNNSYRNTRRRSRAKDGLTTVMEVDENNNNPGAVNRNNQMNADRSLMESSSVLVEDENLLNVNIDAISASELPASASPMNDDVFFSPAKSSPLYKSPLDDDDNNDSAITGGSSNNDDDKSPAATATTCIEKNKDKFELRVYRDHATFGNKLSPIVSCPKHVSIAANTTTAKSEKQRSKQQQQQQQQPRAASRFVSISHVGGHGASSCCSGSSSSSSTFNYNTTSGDSGVGDERTGAYIQLIVEDFNKDVTKHAHSTPNEDEPACSTTEKQQQEQSKSPAIVVTDASSSSSVRKSTKIPQLKMQSMANSSLYRRRVTRLTQHFEEVIKGKGQQPAKKELLVQPGKLGGAPSFVANKSVRSPSYQSREAQKLLRTSKNRSKISFALSPIKTKHHVNFTTARFNRTRPSSCSDCSSGAQDATSASFNACSTGGGSYNCLVTSCSDVTQSSSLCGSYTVNRRSHSASDATPSSIEQSRLQRAIDNKCINVRRRQLTPYYVRPVLLNQQQQQQQPQQQQQQRTRLHANSPGNKTISKIVKRKSIGYVSSPIKAQVKPVKELRKMFSPSYNHTLAQKNEGLKKVRNLLEPNVPVISISKS
ncbi:uncharacterized protein LOC106656745 [Trichogramma pretiosum]|uniref:uncharacterized protein LOC106656745 n=1 Tax=Trichogramma pretiosum TaxID=7493 RepID=UPI0006C96639|nr:uncharacterized protein LOC106656745 [Trichogramma pretiosum]